MNTFQAPQTASQIAEQKRKDAQGLIDSTSALYDTQVADEKQAGQQRLNKNNSINVLSGLMGSTEAVRTDNEVSSANQKAVDAVNAKRAVALQSIYSQISKDADTEAEQQKQDATSSAENILARRKQSQTDAITNLTAMAKSGAVDFDAFKSSPQNAKVYQYALDAVGGSEDALKGLFAANRPQDQLVGTPVRVGDHYVQAYKNPLTGKVSYDTIAIPGGLPTEYTQFQRIGKDNNTLIAIPDNWDGDVSKIKTIYSAAAPSTDDTPVGDNPQLYAGLTTKTATAVRGQVSAFKTEPTVQNFAVVQEGRNFAGSLSNTTKNPADDQGLIYSLAKALDPGSVVREGEYATAQKYAQSWIAAYGKGITQALAGTGFLSEQARKNIKDTIEAKYKASLQSYTNLQTQYQTGINDLTGRDDGSKFLRNYQTPSQPQSSDLKSQAAAKGYDYDAMKSDGHSDEEIQAALGQ